MEGEQAGSADPRPIPPSSQDAGGSDAPQLASASEDEEVVLPRPSAAKRFGSVSSMHSEASEDDPRQVGMENGLFGDYDLKKSPSTKDFVLSYIDDEMARRNLPGRLSSIANESLTAKRGKDAASDPLLVVRPEDLAPLAGGGGGGTTGRGEGGAGAGAGEGGATPAGGRVELVYEPEDDEPRLGAADNSAPLARQLFKAMAEVYMEGVESIVDDNFWKCFQSHKPRPWNWNAYLWPLWLIGAVVRYLLLFPVRMAIFVGGWLLFGLGMLIVQLAFAPGERRTRLEHSLISMMCGVFCITWGAVIRYHGAPVKTRPGECQPVYVANHTSMIDVIILQQMRCFSLVGQRHKGVVRFLQEVVLGCLQCVWFDRGEIKDRAAVAKKLKEHAMDPTRNPLLVFPEGTCVNNKYVIQFKKGIFEIGAPVVPVAIKYNKMFVDPFWNSRAQSFPMHLVELMTSWCLICEVWYLKPHVRREGESSTDFAARCKKSIADKAGLKNVNWDGYMKYWKPSERYLRSRQATFAKALRGIVAETRRQRLQARLETQAHADTLVGAVAQSAALRKRIVSAPIT